MTIDRDLALFMGSPVMIILGTRNDALQPEIGRGAGALVDAERDRVDLLVSSWQWPETVANVRATGQLAATFARPADYVSYQVKGRAELVPLTSAHHLQARRYIDSITSALVGLGQDRETTARWFAERDLVALSLRIDEAFVQTPGIKAGQAIRWQR